VTRLVEDRALLDAFRRGDRAALAELYREYVRPVYAMVRGGFTFESGGQARRFDGHRDPAAVENVVQEVFARAFAPAARAAYDGLRPYRNYLFTIGRNFIIDSLRGGGRAASAEVDEAAPTAEVAPASAEDEIHARQVAAHTAAFVDALEPGDRALFDARFREGLSVEESARRLGVSEHKVKAGERRLKKRFFLYMKERGYFEGYRLNREGLERVGLLLVLFALGGRG